MQYKLPAVKDNATATLDSTVSPSTATIPLTPGDGVKFPTIRRAAATSTGDSATLNSTGIGALGLTVGDFIENVTDGSQAYVLSIATDSITTTTLEGGSDNTWTSGDVWAAGRFIVTLGRKSTAGVWTAQEQVLIGTHAASSDTMTAETVPTTGRGFAGTSAAQWVADESCELLTVAEMFSGIYKAVSSLAQNKADLSTVTALLNARNWKQSVRCATTANITRSGAQTIDGVSAIAGDRVLVKNQSSGAENGVYVVASGSWTRATDFDSSAEIVSAVIPVEEGTSGGDTTWICTNNSTVVVGTTALAFTQSGTSVTITSQANAEAGTNNTEVMTPLRTAQEIDALVKRQLAATFAEAITAGTPVAFKNGQVVKSFSRYGVTPSYSAAPFTPLTNNVGMRSCKVANGRIVTVKSTGSSGSVNFSVQTSDVDANGVFTNATATGWSGGTSGIVPQAFDIARLDDTHFIVFYQVNSTSTAVFYNIGTVATNGLITMAGQTTLASSGLVTSILSTLRCATIANNKIVCSYAGSGLLGATVVTWNGTAITAGSPSLSPIVPVGTYDIDTCKVDTDKFAIVHLMGSYTVAVVVATVSGTTISPWGTQTNTSVAAINSRPLAASQVSAGKIAIGFGVSGVGYRALISTVSGTTPSFGLPATIGTPDTAVNNGGLQFCQNGDGAFIARHFSSSNIRINFIAVSGTSMAMSEQSYAATSLTYATTLLLLNNYVGQLIFGFVNASVYETLCAGNFQASNGFDGFANATTAAAASGVVDLSGKENTSQSGLTAATRYFVNYDNALTVTQDGTNTPRAGVSLSTTSILCTP